MNIAFESISKFLLVAHFAASVVLVGASTHDLVILIGLLRKKVLPATGWKREKFYNKTAFYSYIACFLIGCVLYPAFRYYVRARYFDVDLPWATGLFEIKEHWLSIGMALVAAAYVLRIRMEPAKDKNSLALYTFAVATVWAIVMFAVISSVILVSLRSV